jgi:hypothetical protein
MYERYFLKLKRTQTQGNVFGTPELSDIFAPSVEKEKFFDFLQGSSHCLSRNPLSN